MASSTSMPTARMSENSTTMLTVRPGELQPEHAGEERGRDRDADEQRGAEAEREQDRSRDQQHAGRDRVLQVAEHLPDDLRLVLGEGDVHRLRPGLLQLRRRSSSRASTVSIRLAPVRFDTSMVMAGRPLTRVIEVASLKVGLTCAMSPSVTDAFGDATIGIFRMSCGFSNSDGTLTAKRPVCAFERAGGDQACWRTA